MRSTTRLGRDFGWLWAAFAASTFGTWLSFDAFALIAVLALDAGPAQVSALAAVGLAAGAAFAVPLGPWVEASPKRPVMVGMDLVRFAALASVPVAYAVGALTLWHLALVSVAVAAADIAFRAASGAFLKLLLPRDGLLVANSRFESTTWTATLVAPPLGGAAIALLGPAATVALNAGSYLLSAAGLTAIAGRESHPATPAQTTSRRGEVLAGWRYLVAHPVLRPLFVNAVLVNGLILAMSPLLAVLMLDRLGFQPWQYAFAFAAPCVGGLIGSRLSGPLVNKYGQRAVLAAAGTLRAWWCLPLAFVPAGPPGLALVLASQFGLVLCIGVYGPVLATQRLLLTPQDRVARTLTAWSVSNSLAVAALTAGTGLLAAAVGLRPALAACAVLLMATPLLLRSPAAKTGSPLGDDGDTPRAEHAAGAPAADAAEPAATGLAAAGPTTPATGR